MIKKVIATLLLSIMLISSPIIAERRAEAGSIAVGITLGQAILETIAILGAGYSLKRFIDGNPIIPLSEATNDAYAGYCTIGSTNQIKYHSNGVLCNATMIDGVPYVINPILQKSLVDSDSWDLITNAQAVYNKVSLPALAGVSKLNLSYKPSVSQAMTNVAAAISGISSLNNKFVGYTQEDIDSISSNEKFQAIRSEVSAYINSGTYAHYILSMHNSGNYFSLIMFNDSANVTVNNNNCSLTTSDKSMKYVNWYGTSASTMKKKYDYMTDLHFLHPNIMFCDDIEFPFPSGCNFAYNDCVYPFVDDVVDIPVGSIVSPGIYTDLYDSIAAAPSDTDYINADDVIANTIIGSAVDGVYDVSVVDTDKIEVVTEDTQYKTGVLGWLEKLWDGIISIPQTILGGLTDVLGDFANWLFVPDALVLDNIMSDMETAVASRTGLLTYPVSALYRLLNTVKNFEQEDCILVLPSFSYKGYVLGSRKEFNLTELTRSDSFKDIYQIYLKVTDLIMIVAVLNLAHKKYEQMMEG